MPSGGKTPSLGGRATFSHRTTSDQRALKRALACPSQSTIAHDRLPRHKAVVDEKCDHLRNVFGLAHTSDLRLGCILGKYGHPLVSTQEVPPRRVDNTRRNSINAKRPQFRAEDWYKTRHGRVCCAGPCRAGHGGMGRHRRDEGEASVLANEWQSSLRRGEMRINVSAR